MKLTADQAKLVEENHNLIYFFANKKHLDLEEYYDVMAIGLCLAAQTYDPSKGAFTTYAGRVIMNEVSNEFYKSKTLKRSAVLCEYDESKSGLDASTPMDVGSVHIFDALTCEEQRVIQYLADGYTRIEIADILELTPSRVRNILAKAKSKLGSRYDYD